MYDRHIPNKDMHIYESVTVLIYVYENTHIWRSYTDMNVRIWLSYMSICIHIYEYRYLTHICACLCSYMTVIYVYFYTHIWVPLFTHICVCLCLYMIKNTHIWRSYTNKYTHIWASYTNTTILIYEYTYIRRHIACSYVSVHICVSLCTYMSTYMRAHICVKFSTCK